MCRLALHVCTSGHRARRAMRPCLCPRHTYTTAPCGLPCAMYLSVCVFVCVLWVWLWVRVGVVETGANRTRPTALRDWHRVLEYLVDRARTQGTSDGSATQNPVAGTMTFERDATVDGVVVNGTKTRVGKKRRADADQSGWEAGVRVRVDKWADRSRASLQTVSCPVIRAETTHRIGVSARTHLCWPRH